MQIVLSKSYTPKIRFSAGFIVPVLKIWLWPWTRDFSLHLKPIWLNVVEFWPGTPAPRVSFMSALTDFFSLKPWILPTDTDFVVKIANLKQWRVTGAVHFGENNCKINPIRFITNSVCACVMKSRHDNYSVPIEYVGTGTSSWPL